MKKSICLLLMLTIILSLAACGGKQESASEAAEETAAGGESAAEEEADFEWTREGYFGDENDNMLSILKSEDPDNPGWSVGCFLGEDMYGWYIPQEGKTLHGNIVAPYDEGEFIVTVSEEGEDGVLLETESGETYHFTPMELPEATIFVTVNTEGSGNIEYAPGNETPEVDPEYPYQSAQINLAEPETYTILAYPDEGWKFVKWTKDGADFSTDAQITLELSETADFIAVFEEDENYVSPFEGLDGSYQGGRAHADVEFIDKTAFITIEWGSSASESARWTIMGEVDPETLTLEYENTPMDVIVYGEDGEIESETQQYDNGSGTIVFTKDGPGFTWHDNMEEDREDVVFEWAPMEEEP